MKIIFLKLTLHQRNKFLVRNYDYKSVQCNTICACDFQPDKKTNLALNLFMCYHVFAQIHKTTLHALYTSVLLQLLLLNRIHDKLNKLFPKDNKEQTHSRVRTQLIVVSVSFYYLSYFFECKFLLVVKYSNTTFNIISHMSHHMYVITVKILLQA